MQPVTYYIALCKYDIKRSGIFPTAEGVGKCSQQKYSCQLVYLFSEIRFGATSSFVCIICLTKLARNSGTLFTFFFSCDALYLKYLSMCKINYCRLGRNKLIRGEQLYFENYIFSSEITGFPHKLKITSDETSLQQHPRVVSCFFLRPLEVSLTAAALHCARGLKT